MKNNMYKLLVLIAIILILTFIIITSIDYYNYDKLTNSAPFRAVILVRSIEFLLPSIICYFAARLIKKRK